MFGLANETQVITAIIAAIGTLGAGMGLKALDWWLSRSSNRDKVDKELRGEYRETISDKRQDISELKHDIEMAKQEIDKLEAEVVEWRDRYYAELSVKIEVIAKANELRSRLAALEGNSNGK